MVARGVWEMSLSPKRGQTDDKLMNNYDFLILSASEFERLTRDLLQKHLGCHIESFTQGRDCGVDLRYAGIKGEHASKRETNTNPTDKRISKSQRLIRVIRAIRVQEPYTSRLNKAFRVHESIRVICAIRVRQIYASRKIMNTMTQIETYLRANEQQALAEYARITGHIAEKSSFNGTFGGKNSTFPTHPLTYYSTFGVYLCDWLRGAIEEYKYRVQMGTLPNTSAERIINCLKNGIVRDYAFAWLARTFTKTTGKPIAMTPEVNTLVGEIVNL